MHAPYRKGQEGALRVQLRAVALGWAVSLPTVETRYDLLLDDGTRIYRAQVKYAAAEDQPGSVIVDLRKETRNNGKKRLYSRAEIDVILVYIPQIDKVLWLGPGLFHRRKSLCFRIAPTRHRCKSARYAQAYVW